MASLRRDPSIVIPKQGCLHGNVMENCKECLIEGFRVEKQAKKGTPIKALKNRSRDQEMKVSKDYKEAGFPKSKRQTMSGAISYLPGDVDPGELLLVECKLTRAGQLVIKTDWLAQIQKQARDMGRHWYALHAWVAGESEHYNKVVIVDEGLWFKVLKDYKDAEAFARKTS
jgi:hypothetical protein